jgi:hypothetical protein
MTVRPVIRAAGECRCWKTTKFSARLSTVSTRPPSTYVSLCSNNDERRHDEIWRHLNLSSGFLP